MQLTIISGDEMANIEVAEDLELENFLALCKLELAPISDIQFEKLFLSYNGQQMNPTSSTLKKQLKELNFNGGDVIHIDVLPATATPQSTHRVPPSTSRPTEAQPASNLVASLISNLVQGIKVPTNRSSSADAREAMMADDIFALCSDPHRFDFLKAEHPELAAAYEANPTDKEAFRAAFRRHKEEMARRARIMQDETSEEGQRYISEMIDRQNIEFMHQFAMEHMPEAFIPVQMLYIRMKINNHPVIAFVDSGAQTSILSESCAKRCDVLRYVDRRYRANAIGIGGSQKMLGRIHSCQVQVNTHIFPCPFEVMSDRDIDILFGLNTLLRHKCSLDLQKMVLRFGDGTETPFLTEAEFQREKEAVHQDQEATSSKSATEGGQMDDNNEAGK